MNKKINFIPIFLMIVVTIYLSLGFFRFVPVENDGMRIALGAQSDILYGTQRYSYEYDAQAGTYQLIELCTKLLNLKPFDGFSLLTILSSITFIFAGACFLKRTIPVSLPVAFFTIVLFQETWVSGYYPNSSIIAAALFSIALLLATWKDGILSIALSGIVFSLGVWSRFDVLLLGSSFLILLVDVNKHSLKRIALFVFTFMAMYIFMSLGSGVSLEKILAGYRGHISEAGNLAYTLNNYSTVFTLVVIYGMIFGMYLLLKTSRWRLAILALVVPLPLIFAYGFSLTSPKYLLYALLFFAVPIAYGTQAVLLPNRNLILKFVAWGGTVLIAGQYFFTPPWELVLARSTLVSTADQVRLRGAITYTPIYWFKEKSRMTTIDTDYKRRFADYIAKNEPTSIVAQDWMGNNWVMYYLQSMNYRIVQEKSVAEFLENGSWFIFDNKQSQVSLTRWYPEHPLALPQSWENELSKASRVLYIGPDQAYAGPIDPNALIRGSVLAKEFQCKPWGGNPRFWTLECVKG